MQSQNPQRLCAPEANYDVFVSFATVVSVLLENASIESRAHRLHHRSAASSSSYAGVVLNVTWPITVGLNLKKLYTPFGLVLVSVYLGSEHNAFLGQERSRSFEAKEAIERTASLR